MSNLKEKLNSRQGASLMIALLFFLLCITTGTVILTAATASTGRISSQKQVQQDYLTVSSAARLVRDQLKGTTFTAETNTIFKDGVLQESPDDQFESFGKLLSETVKADATSVFVNGTTPESRKFTIKLRNLDLEPVKAIFEMDENYNITILFHIGQDEVKNSPLVLTGLALTEENIDIKTWEDEIIEGDPPTNTIIQHKTNTKTLTVSWDDFIITNEEASE
jgi:hypothetical protein